MKSGDVYEVADVVRNLSFKQKDKGQSDAFNKGFAHAKGRFGCWLNADDILMPNAKKY